MGRRTLLLVAAVLLAAIGTGVLFVYVNAKQNSLGAVGNGEAGMTAVLVPVQAVPAGARISASLRSQFQSVEVPDGLVGPGRLVTKFDDIQDRVTTQALPAFVPVSLGQFGGAVKQGTELEIPKGQMALTIDVDDSARVSSFLKPGLDVALFVVDPDTRPGTTKHQARLVLPKVTVLTTGTSATILPEGTPTAGTGDERGAQSLVTLLVNQEDAGAILVAQAAGELHLALLGAGTSPRPQTFNDDVIDVG